MAGEPRFDLDAWLTGLGLAQYSQAFRDNHVDGDVLRSLTADDLRDLGVTSVGHRRKLLDAAARWNAPGAATAPAEPDAPPIVVPAVRPVRSVPGVQRRQITVLFCDLVGSTALSVRADPEDLRDYLNTYRGVLAQVVQEHEGWIAQYLGDGVLAYFGYPQAHEHDAEHAVRAGLAIVDRVARMPAIQGQVPQVRIGIATGMTVIGAVLSSDEGGEQSAVGETPNLAARAQAAAEPNCVVIAPATRQLIGGLFECRELGAFTLKGFADPVPLWQVTRESEQNSRFDALRAASRHALVGRDAEVALIMDRLSAARAGEGSLMVVSGDGGMGKSRLVGHLFGAIGATPGERLVFQCSPYNTATPLYPVRYLLERAAGIVAADGPAAALAKLSVLLARAGPVSAERLALVGELLRLKQDEVSPLANLGSHELRRRTMQTLTSVLEAATAKVPVIVIEDVHWIDPSSAELFGGLLSRLSTLPVLIIATTRPGLLPQWIADARHGVVVLDRLNAEPTRQLVRAVAAPRVLSPAVEDAIVARSDGVPIFAEELTRGFLETEARGAGESEAARIPSTLTESLLARLDRFEHGRAIAPMAAVIGREFPIELLVAACPLPEAQVQLGIRELLDAGVFVTGHSRFGAAIAFRHMLVREAAYQLLVRRERVRLHARVAATIESRFAPIAEALPHIVAFHYTEAGDGARAIVQWERAGVDADRRSAYLEAMAHFNRALDLTLKLPANRARDEREFALRTHLIGPLIAARGFQAGEVGREIECASALGHRLGTRASVVPALALKLMWLATAGNLEASYGMAMRLHDAAQDGSEVDRLIAHRYLSTTLIFRGQFKEGLAEAEAFLSLYDHARHAKDMARVGPSTHHVMVMVGMAEICTFFERPEEANAWRERSLAAARDNGTVHTLCQVLVFSGCFLSALTGERDALAAYAAELYHLTHAHDLSAWRGHSDLFQGISLIQQGQVEEGLAQAQRGVGLLRAAHAYSNIWYILYAHACEQAGRGDEAQAALDVAAPLIATGESWLEAEFLRVRSRLRLARGDAPAAVREDFAAALEIAQRQGAHLFAGRAARELEALDAGSV